jgi:hypothetical protein
MGVTYLICRHCDSDGSPAIFIETQIERSEDTKSYYPRIRRIETFYLIEGKRVLHGQVIDWESYPGTKVTSDYKDGELVGSLLEISETKR